MLIGGGRDSGRRLRCVFDNLHSRSCLGTLGIGIGISVGVDLGPVLFPLLLLVSGCGSMPSSGGGRLLQYVGIGSIGLGVLSRIDATDAGFDSINIGNSARRVIYH